MNARKIEALKLVVSENVYEEEFSIPLDISDIINICKEYSNLGLNIQQHIDTMLDCGVEQSIAKGAIKPEHLIFIKNFLKAIVTNPYFGDATTQAQECINLIEEYQSNNKQNVIKLLN